MVKKSGLYLIGNLSSKILNALLLPIYAFYLSKDDLGYFDNSQTIMNVVVIVLYIAIWESILRFGLTEKNNIKKEKYITSAIIFCTCVSLGILFISVFISILLKYPLLITIAFMSVFYALAQIWQYFARALFKNNEYVISGILGTIVNFLLIILLVCIFEKGFWGLIISYSLGRISTLLYLEIKIKLLKKIKIKRFSFHILKKMILYSAPLVLNLVSGWFISGFNRVVITKYLGVSITGLYSFADKFSILITMLGSVITMAVIEETILSRKNENLGENFSKTIKILFKLFLDLGIIMVPFIGIFYNIIKNTEFYYSIYFCAFLILYAIFQTMASNIGSIFQAIDKTRYQFTTTLTGAFCTVVITFLMLNNCGIYAVLFGQVVGSLVMVFTRYILVNKFISFKLEWIKIVAKVVFFVVLYCMILNETKYFQIIVCIICIIYFIINYFYFIKKIYKYLKIKIKG